MEMWEIACLNVFLTLCHCNKHPSLSISPKVAAIFISLQCAKCKNWQTLKMAYSRTTFCSFELLQLICSIQIHLTLSTEMLLCIKEFGKLSICCKYGGTGFELCSIEPLGGYRGSCIKGCPRRGVAKGKAQGMVLYLSHVPTLQPGKLRIRVLYSNGPLVVYKNKTKLKWTNVKIFF